MLLPAASVTVPGLAVVVFISVLNTCDAFPLQPLPPVSLHVPVNVLDVFVHAVLPPLDAHVGFVLSILTV